jgi:SpoVK/Ycf46/Vps4 family AAA+-type ATPase
MNFIDKMNASIYAEEDKQPDQSSIDSKIWYKFSGPSGDYFSPFVRSKHELKYFESPEAMSKFLKGTDKSYDIKTENLVEIYEKTTPNEPPIELSPGIYFHEYSSSATPERLTPTVVRADKYIELMDSLIDLDRTVDDFIDNKQLYDDSCASYKLGVLLFGPPGTGKTSYLREFIRKRKAIVIFMDGVPSRKFLEKIEVSTKNTLKIFVFEEAVSLLENSEDIRDMLEFLDGPTSVSNAIYFLSTNYPESIPENVVRNGRIDVFVRVEYPSVDARKKLMNLYLKRDPSETELKLTENMPIVDIREMCFTHKKTEKSFAECAKLIEEKNKMLKKHFGKAREIRLT